MKVYYGMPADEFVQTLRDSAIRAKVAPLVIDAIDNLFDLGDQTELIEDLEAKIEMLESEIVDLKERLDANKSD